MSNKVKVAGTWREVSMPYVKVAGVWKPAKAVYNKVAGKWYSSFLRGGVNDFGFATYDYANKANAQVGGSVGKSLAIQPDGKILVCGTFTTWNGVTVGRIVRLNTDGTVDTTFQTNIGTGPNSSVFTITVNTDGTIFVGGGFTTWNGTPVGYMVKLSATGTLDTTFNTNIGTGASGSVYAITVNTDGTILVGGNFITWNGTTVGRMVKLSAAGVRDTTFNTNIGTGANSVVNAITVNTDGTILVGGSFGTWNGTTVGYMVKLSAAGVRDTTFTTNNGTGANSTINAIAVNTDGTILAGGGFTTWNGTAVGRMVKLSAAGVRDTTFTTNNGTGANDSVFAITVNTDGTILVGGNLTAWSGTTVGRMVKLSAAGVRDTTFQTNIGTGSNSSVFTITVNTDGTILVGGNITTWNGTTVGYMVKLSAAGVRDTAFQTNIGTGANSRVSLIAISPDKKAIVTGEFTGYNSINRTFIARIGGELA